MGLAENEVDTARGKVWLLRLGVSALVLVLIGLTVTGLQSLAKKKPGAKQQMAKITILNQPPPPPPPPPKEQPKPVQQPKDAKVEQLKQIEAPPQPAPSLKMEGEASANGVAGLAAGAVTSEYKGQPLGDGQKAGGIGRAEFATYLTRLQRLIQEALVRNPRFKGSNYKLPASVRLREDGSLRSVELAGTTGDKDIDELMRSELLHLIQQDPPPGSAPSGGFTVRVTNRMLN